MRLFPTVTKRKQRPTSLARHIFVRVAFPVGIIFLSCFSLLDQLLQVQLRSHIQQELVTRDTQTSRAHSTGEERLRRSLDALADASGLTQSLTRAQRTPSGTFLHQVAQLSSSLDEDIYAISGVDRKLILAVRRKDKALLPINQQIPFVEERRLAELDGDYYFLSSYPLQHDGAAIGWIVIGRHWLRNMPVGDSTYVVARNGKVVRSTGLQPGSALREGFSLPACAGGAESCEFSFDLQRHLLLRSAATSTQQDPAIYLVQSLDLLASPILGITRGLMLAGALLSIGGAFGMALLSGRAISRPLFAITRAFARAQESGNLSDIQLPTSRIAEVNAMAETLHNAVRSIEDGQNKLTQVYFQFMGAIVAMLDARDAYTAGHSHRVSAYSEALARDFGLPQDQIDDIRIGALLHDIGKIGVPDEILRKHERLTKEEFDLMKQHPTIGRKVLERVVQFEKYLDVVELHHENLDGTGYPRGLRGEQIPIAARIVKVADVYDALSTDRPYRKSMSQEEVHEILRKGSGTHFDRLLVEIFLTRCVPSFEHRTGLEQLHRAVSETPSVPPARKAVGA